VKFRLTAGVFVAKGLGFDATPTARLAVVHCPMSVASVAPLRDVENARVVVRIEGRCVRELSTLRFLIGSAQADVLSTQTDSTGAEALLRVGTTDAASGSTRSRSRAPVRNDRHPDGPLSLR
jgi:hypothetical protein